MVSLIMILTSSCVLSWCVPRGLHFGVCLGVYLGALGQGRGSLMRRQSRRNTFIYTGPFAIMFNIRKQFILFHAAHSITISFS